MSKGPSNAFTEKQVALYTDEYYERADLVFRFGALLTCSREGGERLTEEAFRLLVEDFARIDGGMAPVPVLMSKAWIAWSHIKSERFHEWKSPILQSMKALGVQQRAMLFASEVAGLEMSEMGSIFGCDESTIRRALAEAHKFLATAAIRV
jgi:DNA-directed RNA polymerase specialized sigma24 family protein